jgi:Fe-Mn family superoxide dismutase
MIMKNKISLLFSVVFFFTTFMAFSQITTPDYSKKPAVFMYKGQAFYQLPYTFNALEPYIDKETMFIHYDKHHKTYFTKYVDAMEGKPELKGKIEDVLKKISQYSEGIKNSAGGYYNHIMYFQLMLPGGSKIPQGKLAQAIDKKFGNTETLKKLISDAAVNRFGSGWAWLVVDANGDLFVCSTANQDNPLMDIAKDKGTPILALDVWEHAYYLKYQNKRKDYIDSFWNVLNWDEVGKLYDAAVKH